MTEVTVEARPAATVALLRSRSSPARLEVLLTRRPASMAFAADMHVFPGGRVDPGDADGDLTARSVLSAGDASKALGGDLTPAAALAVHVAAIREVFEEAGVLLADGGDRVPVVPARAVSQARSALVGGEETFATVASELGLRLRTDWLVALSRWVTPAGHPRRFDARFFAAEMPAGARVSFEGDEVAGHAWMTPGAGLSAMARGEIGMWLPTSATLQQLEHVASVDEIRQRVAPGALGEIVVEELSREVTRIVMPAGGGVAGQPVCAYLVGRGRFVLVDPGDPIGPALDRAVALAASRGGAIVAIALTHTDPDHAGGAETLAETLGIPVLAGPGGGRPLPYTVRELADMELLASCDVPLRVVHAPGPRSDHIAFITGDGAFVLAGDLGGARGARAVVGPWEEAAAAASRDRLHRLVPEAVWLHGHPASEPRASEA